MPPHRSEVERVEPWGGLQIGPGQGRGAGPAVGAGGGAQASGPVADLVRLVRIAVGAALASLDVGDADLETGETGQDPGREPEMVRGSAVQRASGLADAPRRRQGLAAREPTSPARGFG